ncbi:hypothetical protein HanRHA438_Chr12g0551281 [Helianthus annuus]|nr:hypothetical protein HanRHA438_Chr12g0551281 [Helianthus annuus]
MNDFMFLSSYNFVRYGTNNILKVTYFLLIKERMMYNDFYRKIITITVIFFLSIYIDLIG